MAASSHTYSLGPADARLTVRTERSGAAAKAGHNLLIEVSSWSGTVDLDAAGAESVTLSVDPGSLRVLEGTGGMQALGDEDRENIEQTIVAEVLRGSAIGFRSSEVQGAGGVYKVQGELTLNGRDVPLTFDLSVGDGRLHAAVTIKQSDWGMKPYSALFGTLKVNDEVVVEIDGRLPAS
jgi:polyisoprenoid-binding protein YceI